MSGSFLSVLDDTLPEDKRTRGLSVFFFFFLFSFSSVLDDSLPEDKRTMGFEWFFSVCFRRFSPRGQKDQGV